MHYVVSETLGRNAPRTAFHSLVTCGIMSDHVTMLLCIHVPMRSMKAFMPPLGSAVAGPPARLASPREFLAFSWQECEISVHYAVEEYVATPSRPGERERRLGAREREINN